MSIVTLAPPSWTSGELLSAGKLNLLAQNINAVKGISAAPTGIFRRTVDPEYTATYWNRRNYRYLHVRYDLGSGSGNFSIKINTNQEYSGTTEGNQWRTFDLDAVTAVPSNYAFYKIELIRPSGRNLTIHEIMESSSSSPTTWGSYSTPSDWTGSETAAQYLTKLSSLSTAVTSMAPAMTPPSPVHLWTKSTDSTEQVYWMRRKNAALSFYYVSDSGSSVTVRVNGSIIHTAGGSPSGITVTIAYGSMPSIPAIGDFFSFDFRIADAAGELRILEEYGAPSAVYAPSISHGSLTHDTEDFTAMVFTLNTAQNILKNAGWQYAVVDRPHDVVHPEWSFRKTARYFHYKRNGSLASWIWDPTLVNDQVDLSKTGDNFATLDLNTLDWLVPNGLAYAYKCDSIWLDDRP